MSIYIDVFLLISNTMVTLKITIKLLTKEYKIKDLEKVKTIINWQIIKDIAIRNMKIN